MKVYVVKVSFFNEDPYVMGVFASVEGANACVLREQASEPEADFRLEQWDVQE